MTKGELISQIAVAGQVKKADVERTLNAFIKTMVDILQQQGRISLAGFGTFTVTERREREGRNPQTGEPIKIAATKVVKFKPGKSLKDTIK
ncbi:HU family DNA-binding protein [Desulfobacca acetoxidans]|uniref:Histone family protein DNA-binding protein n=1 Tax=Desulfobacca acetoxidans (strain ATCC 700848 / DSM 11109 / ASRB2) TaxID=880072 RepID=F2NFP4_DESAR|nr:HU family DNA-binding protein [Desulfobacca acetoxidans]AEB10163.1 histone family protein DNA-binding protein [Desulfobacca acetoxidans DSM 11109]